MENAPAVRKPGDKTSGDGMGKNKSEKMNCGRKYNDPKCETPVWGEAANKRQDRENRHMGCKTLSEIREDDAPLGIMHDSDVEDGTQRPRTGRQVEKEDDTSGSRNGN